MPQELNNKDLRTVGIILAIGILIIIFCLFWAARTISAEEKAHEYKLTEVQQLKLKVTQQEAQLLQAQLQNIQRQFQDKVSQLMQEAQKVKLENSWPPETAFNPDTLQFSAPPAKEEKK
jgi:peroxiredoxin family protein